MNVDSQAEKAAESITRFGIFGRVVTIRLAYRFGD